jgi:hypothetical protein
MNGKWFGLIGNVLCPTIFRIPALYAFRVSLCWYALFQTPTRTASPIVVMLVAAFALIGLIALIQR